MKNIKITSSIILLLILCGCNTTIFPSTVSAPDKSNIVYVSMMDNSHISFDAQQKEVIRGHDVEFVLNVEDKYYISSVNYEEYDLNEVDSNKYKLTLHNIKSALRIDVELFTESMIRYHLNGGEFLEPTKYSEADNYIVKFNTNLHKRINTSLGNEIFKKDGYTLLGWNTKEDCSGEHIGIGSRTTIIENGITELYAEWAKWSDQSLFEYTRSGNTISISNYKGDEKIVVVPQIIDGLQVNLLKEGTFLNNSNVETIILPIGLGAINPRAFKNCENFNKLYFYDDLQDVYDNSFVDCPNFKTININSSHNPTFDTYDKNRHYADKIDLLILSEEINKPRMVFMSGSSMWYSLEGYLVDDYFEKEYTVVNVALNSFYAAIPQFEIIGHYLKKDDVFIHAPEVCSEQELMYVNNMELRMWEGFELNYDLMSLVDIRKCSTVFSSFDEYNAKRETLDKKPYETPGYINCIDEYGCIPFERPMVNGDENLADPVGLSTIFLTEEAFGRLNGFYDEFASITEKPIMFGYAPLNQDAIPNGYATEKDYRDYEKCFEDNLTENVRYINTLKDSIFRGHYFYQTNYHLGTEASIIWTNNLCQGIERALVNER